MAVVIQKKRPCGKESAYCWSLGGFAGLGIGSSFHYRKRPDNRFFLLNLTHTTIEESSKNDFP